MDSLLHWYLEIFLLVINIISNNFHATGTQDSSMWVGSLTGDLTASWTMRLEGAKARLGEWRMAGESPAINRKFKLIIPSILSRAVDIMSVYQEVDQMCVCVCVCVCVCFLLFFLLTTLWPWGVINLSNTFGFCLDV